MHVTVVGAGLTGLSAAAELVRGGANVTVYETRQHLGGNCYDRYMDADGGPRVLVHQYGGHVLNTDDHDVMEFANSFGIGFRPFRVKVVARTDMGLIPVPFNDISACIVGKRSDDEIVDLVFKNYSVKQWGRAWQDLPESIRKRVPARRLGADCSYHRKIFSGVPSTSYANWFDAMASGATVITGCGQDDWRGARHDAVIYTGMLDQYFDFSLGRLKYRSLTWDYRIEPKRYYHIVNDCTDMTAHTRSVDHSHWLDQYVERTVVGYEYPCEYLPGESLPMYPDPDHSNELLASAYRALAHREDKVVFVGRLGMNKYIDMDEAIRQGRNAAQTVLGRAA